MTEVDFEKWLDEHGVKEPGFLESQWYRFERFIKDVPFRCRNLKYRLQKGFWMEEAWNVDIYATKFLIPRLKELRDNMHSYTMMHDSIDDWKKELDFIIEGLEIKQKFDNGDIWFKTPGYLDMWQKSQHAVNLVAKYYDNLWD